MQNIIFSQYKTSKEIIAAANARTDAPKLFIETYGCQMNVADSELVTSVMISAGYALCDHAEDADLLLINTCAVRDNAEQRIRNRLQSLAYLKKKRKGMLFGLLGCMAERIKSQLLEEEKMVDLIAGPDAYRSLPTLVLQAKEGESAVNVLLSREETYADISPVRKDTNGVSAFVSITRGCDNMCAFCVVPFTRGRERSRSPHTILDEIRQILSEGYKEVTLLGQNVDKYNWENGETTFAQLLELTAQLSPDLRVRFATSYPQDFTDEVLTIMSKYPNICKYIHLPVQAGSSKMLETMKRGYSREWYLERIASIRRYIPDCAISTDIIAGHPTETDDDHEQTLSVMREVAYDYAYMFKYSERPGTYAAKYYPDDVPEDIKSKRLQEIIDLQTQLSLESNKRDIGKIFEVLIEGESKKSNTKVFGRNSQNKVAVFERGNYQTGDYVNVKITNCTSATLIAELAD